MQKTNLQLIGGPSNYSSGTKNVPAVMHTTNSAKGISPALSFILQELRREIGSRSSQSENSLDYNQTELVEIIDSVAQRCGFELTGYERDEVLAQIESSQKVFGVLQELVDDPDVSDIIVTNYAKICVQQGRRNYTTGLSFADQNSYETFVERLLQKANSSYSTKKPIADGMIGAFARVHVVHKCICESGPYLTIRLNRFASVTCKELISNGMAPQELFAYLNGLVKTGNTVLVVGEVGTGKTTLVRALASSIPEEESILVIEDTPEIRLEHPQVRYLNTREANTDGEGRIAPRECIRGGMRMAMNRIIFGEMRDAEAAEAFVDVCASGHPGLSTIHARSASEAVARLELFLGRAQKGVSRNVLTEQIATSVQAIVFVNICKVTKKRRIMMVKEIGPVADGVLRQRDIFSYQTENGNPQWKVLTRASAHREMLEAMEEPVLLHTFPPVLELSLDQQYKDAATFKHMKEGKRTA